MTYDEALAIVRRSAPGEVGEPDDVNYLPEGVIHMSWLGNLFVEIAIGEGSYRWAAVCRLLGMRLRDGEDEAPLVRDEGGALKIDDLPAQLVQASSEVPW